MIYRGAAPNTGRKPVTGVLLVNLGTPDSTKTVDVRRYLKEFLSDSRVVEMPRALWWLILNGIILNNRPKKSAALYEKIWTESGSPLLHYSKALAKALQAKLNKRGDSYKLVLAMRYGAPSIKDGLEQLRRANAQNVVILPLYPQYSATTTASTFDAISQELRHWRWIPELHLITHYHNNAGYIQTIADSVTDFRAQHGNADRLLISFHGIPQHYADAGDPYPLQCQTSAELIANKLELSKDQWAITYQSRMGRKPWLQPYTEETLKRWGDEGVKHVQVICPGFPADCLETIEEIGEENRDYFIQAGGESYQYIPALNASDSHANMLHQLLEQHSSTFASS